MDVNMPRMNGLQATQQIQTLLGPGAPPIIGLTAAASPEDRARCLDAGMNDYLTKPLHVADLAHALERWADGQGITPSPDTSVQDLARAGVAAEETRDAPATGEPVLMDFDRLAQFREFDDDELTLTREVISLFMADATQRVEAIARAIRAHDAEALSWASHALVGATGNVGAVAMQSVGIAFEIQAKAGVVPINASQELERLQVYWHKTRAVLDAWL
jgi:DNA-binding response OmpR family regulator